MLLSQCVLLTYMYIQIFFNGNNLYFIFMFLGIRNGVATKLANQVPDLIRVHCVAHRLNLAVSQSAKAAPYMVKFERYLKNLFWFYQNSSVRNEKLKAIQQLLEVPELKCQVCEKRFYEKICFGTTEK